jgi:uncharacterized RDD family membrane protein YckC
MAESASVPARGPKPKPPAFPEHLRQHLQDRVQRYRARQDRSLPLPFDEPQPPSNVITFPPQPVPETEIRVSRSRPREPRPAEPAQTSAPQAALEFHPLLFEPETAWRQRAVAPLRARVAGHLKDLAWIAAGAGCLTGPLLGVPYISRAWFGGTLVANVLLLAGLLCGSLVLALLYGLLFFSVKGATPGMRTAGLHLVTFDGKAPSRQQRILRVLGAFVSAGSFFIGFLWAAVDEEKLYWHDHISKTFLTMADL